MNGDEQSLGDASRERVERAARQFIALRGYPPTVRDIAKELTMSPSYVFKHLLTLRGSGVLTWDDGRPRTLRFLQPPASPAES